MDFRTSTDNPALTGPVVTTVAPNIPQSQSTGSAPAQFSSITGTRPGPGMRYPDKDRDGLYWEFDDVHWCRKPAIDAIERVCRRALEVAPDDPCEVTFIARGSFNRVYLVKTDKDKVIMRVSLPVEPGVRPLPR